MPDLLEHVREGRPGAAAEEPKIKGMGFTVVHGLSQVIKENKRGFWLGLWQRLLMISDIVLISWRIYVVLHVKLLVGRLLPDREVMEPVEPVQRSDR